MSDKVTGGADQSATTVCLPFAILPDELAALRRFHECVNDGQGYDVPRDMMCRLAELGLVHRKSGSIYEHTVFGLSVLNGEFEHHYAVPSAMLSVNDETNGLYRKFNVERTDGSSAPGGKHHNCEYFVLDLCHDKHAIPALRAYAESCAAEYPVLSADLRKLARPADCFVDVPETTLPCGIVVPAFRVGQYLSSRGGDDKVSINADNEPWVNINYHDAKRACADAGLSLITETQWLAIAHDIAQQDINWTGGKVGKGKVYQGLHNGSVNSAQPVSYEPADADERRWHQLSTGQRIYDFAGNAFSWVFDDVQGDASGLTTIIKADSPSLTTAPYLSMEKGMGWRPGGERDWSGSGRALVRGGYWRSSVGAGVFSFGSEWSDSESGGIGFRCTTKSGDRI